jgi:H+/gluconate symporter-like permease
MANKKFSEQITLANTNEFINKIKIALLIRANELYLSVSPQNLKTLQKCSSILKSGASEAQTIALVIAASNSTISAIAPAVPDDDTIQSAVNQVLPLLID